MLGSFNNWNIIHSSHKTTRSDEIDKINQVLLDIISDNTATLVKTGKCGGINTTDTTTMGYHNIKFVSEVVHLLIRVIYAQVQAS